MKKKILGIVIIAAGSSSRLGSPKQLIKINGKTLLRKSLDLASRFSDKRVCVLGYQADRVRLGANIDQLEGQLGGQLGGQCEEQCEAIFNPDWSQGMGRSIATGCEYFEHKVDAIMVMLCDQYLLEINDIEKLCQQWQQQPDKIIASEYFEKKHQKIVVGAPAIFPKHYFKALKKLQKTGAREIIEKNANDRVTIRLNNAATDLDTKDDLKILLRRNHD